jgi:DNA repair protein RadC
MDRKLSALLRSRPDLAERLLVLAEPPPKSVTNAADSAAVVRPILEGRETEAFACIALDAHLRVIGTEIMTTGTDAYTVVCRSQILRWALTRPRGAARSIILAHNHPSGNPEPSREDIATTRLMYRACEAVGIELADHIIIGDGGLYVSLAERGQLKD